MELSNLKQKPKSRLLKHSYNYAMQLLLFKTAEMKARNLHSLMTYMSACPKRNTNLTSSKHPAIWKDTVRATSRASSPSHKHYIPLQKKRQME